MFTIKHKCGHSPPWHQCLLQFYNYSTFAFYISLPLFSQSLSVCPRLSLQIQHFIVLSHSWSWLSMQNLVLKTFMIFLQNNKWVMIYLQNSTNHKKVQQIHQIKGGNYKLKQLYENGTKQSLKAMFTNLKEKIKKSCHLIGSCLGHSGRLYVGHSINQYLDNWWATTSSVHKPYMGRICQELQLWPYTILVL